MAAVVSVYVSLSFIAKRVTSHWSNYSWRMELESRILWTRKTETSYTSCLSSAWISQWQKYLHCCM